MLARARLALTTLRAVRDGMRFAHSLSEPVWTLGDNDRPPNPLEAYFDSVKEGPGIWKWRHYFPIYHRHLERFRGRSPNVVEIGIYSGGSLPMWLDYFGKDTQVYGVDIEPACQAHERDGVRIFVGDQADPSFWERFIAAVPRIDVVIDDGGHQAEQQITSLRWLLPRIAPGGVYICEDIEGEWHQTHSFIDGLCRPLSEPLAGTLKGFSARPVHQQIASIHRYPMVAVVEKQEHQVERFPSEKHGTVWQPGIYD
jgi:hypothetical protein